MPANEHWSYNRKSMSNFQAGGKTALRAAWMIGSVAQGGPQILWEK